MSTQEKIGKIVRGTEERDAIHIAVIPARADQKLAPGAMVRLVGDWPCAVEIGNDDDSIGVVDPFLQCAVLPGQTFWLFLRPNTVTGMRHHWEHPAFIAEGPSESVKWLMDFAERAGLGYERMMGIVEDYVDNAEVWVERDSERARDVYYECSEDFWKHYEAVTGVKEPKSERHWGAPFSCSC